MILVNLKIKSFIDFDIQDCEVLNHLRGEFGFLGSPDIEVFEVEVGEFVLVIVLADVEEDIAIHLAVLHSYVVSVGHRRILTSLEIEELAPRLYIEEILCCTVAILHGGVFILLGCVSAHLEAEEYSFGAVDAAIAHYHVVVIDGLASEGEAAVGRRTEVAVFNDYVLVASVAFCLGRVIGPGAFASLHRDAVVIDGDVTTFHVNVLDYVEIDGIGTGTCCIGGLAETVDMEIEEPYKFAIVDMGGPERTVLQTYVLYLNVLAVRYIYKSGALLVLVGAGPVPAAAQPERLMIAQSVSVDCTLAADGESVQSVGVDEGSEICAGLALDSCLAERVVTDEVASHQSRTLFQIEVSALFEPESARLESSGGNDYHSATVGGRLVDEGLDFRCMKIPVGEDAVVCENVFLAEIVHVYGAVFTEPSGYRCSIGEQVLGNLVLLDIFGLKAEPGAQDGKRSDENSFVHRNSQCVGYPANLTKI